MERGEESGWSEAQRGRGTAGESKRASMVRNAQMERIRSISMSGVK